MTSSTASTRGQESETTNQQVASNPAFDKGKDYGLVTNLHTEEILNKPGTVRSHILAWKR